MNADIPDDIMKIGESIAADIPSRVSEINRTFAGLVIARAILAEREKSAAPELLKSLKRLLLEFDFLVEGGDIPDIRYDIIFVAARSAVAKAEGSL